MIAMLCADFITLFYCTANGDNEYAFVVKLVKYIPTCGNQH